jgi:hypothetical protein
VRQFRAFDQAGVAAEFAVPPHWQVTSMSAFGHVPPGAEPPDVVAADPARQRRSLAEITWPSDPPSSR